ncbi:MAG: formyltransferase family protein [Flavobacteriales bacterium]
MKHRVVLLTNGSRAGQGLAHALAMSPLDLALIVVEQDPTPPPPKGLGALLRSTIGHNAVNRMNLWRQPRKLRHMLQVERVLQHSADLMLEQEMADMGFGASWPGSVDLVRTLTINDPATAELIRNARPDVLAVFGTGVLKEHMLSLAPSGALNAHSSILPWYKGTRSEFWQCLFNDRDHVGITIHRIDPGVDTGDILFQAATATNWPSDPFSLRSLNTIAVLKHFPNVITDHLENRIRPRVQESIDQPTFRSRDMTVEKRMALFNRFSL